MKHKNNTLFIVEKILSVLVFMSLFPAFGEWENALSPKGKKVTVKLAEYPSIITSSKPDAREQYAAGLLSGILEKITGTRLEIKNAGAGKKAFRFAPIDPKLGDSGYRIEINGSGDIVLSGGTRRGVINAVIALLEEDIGVRWYTGSTPRIPACPDGIVSVVPRSYQPRLVMREPFYQHAFDWKYEILNRTNQTWQSRVPENLGGAWNFPFGAFCHTMHLFLPAALFKDHPEYFAMINGKRRVNRHGSAAAHLCMTNPEVVKIVARNAVKVLKKEKKPAEIISISQNDGGKGFCQCEKCAEMTRNEGSVSGPLIYFVNRVADEINKEYPDVKVETLAYLESFLPPKTVRPGKNVMIRLCTDSHAWHFPLFFIEESVTFLSALKQWHAIGADLLIWDYVTEFHEYPKPNPNLWVMDHNFDLLLSYDVKGIMLQGSYQSPGGADAILKSWIFAKRMWDPRWKLDALLEDFLEGYYGPAAPAMREYYQYQKQCWQTFHDRHKGKPLVKPGPVFSWSHKDAAKLKQILNRAFQLAGNDPAIRNRLNLTEFSFLYLRLKLGPKDLKDLENYKSDIKRFRKLAETIRFTHYREGGGPRQLDKLIRIFECRIADELYRKKPEGAFRYCPHNVRIWKCGEQTAYLVKEGDRTILAQKGGRPAWSMQWKLSPRQGYASGIELDTFPKGRKYKLRLTFKADAEPDAGTCFRTAVYEHATKKYYGEILVRGEHLKGKSGWITLESRPFEPHAGAVLYVSPATGSDKLKTLYVDHVLMVPCPQDKTE